MQKKIIPRQQGSVKMTPEFVKNVVKHLQCIGQIPCDSTEETIKLEEEKVLNRMEPENKEFLINEYELEHIPECPICGAERYEEIVHACHDCYLSIDKETCLNNKGYCQDCYVSINEGLSDIIEYKKELGVKCQCMNFHCRKCLNSNCEDENCPIHKKEKKDERRRKIRAIEGMYYISTKQEFIKLFRNKFAPPEPDETPKNREEFLERVATTHIESGKKKAEEKVVELEEEIKWIRAMIARSELDMEADSKLKLKKLKNPKSPTARRLLKNIERPLIEHLQKIGQIGK